MIIYQNYLVCCRINRIYLESPTIAMINYMVLGLTCAWDECVDSIDDEDGGDEGDGKEEWLILICLRGFANRQIDQQATLIVSQLLVNWCQYASSGHLVLFSVINYCKQCKWKSEECPGYFVLNVASNEVMRNICFEICCSSII